MTLLIAKICCFLQIHRLAYFLNRNRKRIITFHNVLPDDVFVNNVANGVSCSLSSFKTIIEEVSRYFDFSLNLDDVKTVTITFDDGYRNQVEIAAPYLISKGFSAYIFVSGQLLPPDEDAISGRNEDAKPLTIDLLLHWVSYAPNGEYDLCFDGKKLLFQLFEQNRQQIWSNVLWPAFIYDSDSKGVSLLNVLDSAYPINAILEELPEKYVEQRLECAKVIKLDELRSKGWEIGWHTYSHYPLSKLTYEEKVLELIPDKRCPSKVLSFPYGGPQEVDKDCLEIAQFQNYSTAVSNVDTATDLTSVWFRSRMTLSSNPILLHFELSGLKHLIKYRKLLPKI